MDSKRLVYRRALLASSILIALLVFANGAYAISAGISPASATVNYADASGNKTVSGSFKIINSDTAAGDMTAYSQSPYVRILQPDTFTIQPGQSHTVEYEVSLPGNYPAGRTSLLITATKNPDNGAAFGIAVALNYVIFIDRKDSPEPVGTANDNVTQAINSTANGMNTTGNGASMTGNPTNWANIPASGMNTSGNSTDANPGALGSAGNVTTATGNQGLQTSAVQGAAQGKNIVQLWLEWLFGLFKF